MSFVGAEKYKALAFRVRVTNNSFWGLCFNQRRDVGQLLIYADEAGSLCWPLPALELLGWTVIARSWMKVHEQL